MSVKSSLDKVPPPLIRFKTYKHRLSIDAAFTVHSCRPMDTHYLVTGEWLNIANPRRPFVVHTDIIKIKYTDLKNWRPYEL